MFFLLAILIGIIIGTLRKGTISNMRATSLSLLPLGLVGIVVQIALHFLVYVPSASSLDMVIPVLNLVSYVFILVMLTFNLDEVWNVMMVVGTMANFVVTFMNAAKMPVAANIVASIDQSALGQSILAQNNLSGGLIENLSIFTQIDLQTTKLWFLGINIKIPFFEHISPMYGAVPGLSIGTILLLIGLIGWIQFAMVHKSETDTVQTPKIQEESAQPVIQDTAQVANLEKSNAVDRLEELETEPELPIMPLKPEKEIEKTQTIDTASDTLLYTKPVVGKEEKQSERPQGFFTQNFYAEKEKSIHKEAEAKPSEEKMDEPLFEKTVEGDDTQKDETIDQKVDTARKATTDTDFLGPSILEVMNKEKISTEDSFFKETESAETKAEAKTEESPVRKQKPIIVATGGSGSGRGRSRKMSQPKKKTGLNEDEMRNVWQNVAKENQKLKQRGRGYVIEEKPKSTDERKFFTKPVSSEKISDVQKQDLMDQTIDERAFSVTKPHSVVEDITASATTDDETRERAGYEKVHVTIDGKEISYWKKI